MKNTGLTWLHLSDFHVGQDEYGQQQLFNEIIIHVQSQKEKGIVPDYVFITGDLANKGLAKEYELFNESFLLPLQKVIGGGIQDRTFSIPGNHDVNRNITPGFSQEKFLNTQNRYFDPTDTGRELRKSVYERFAAFGENDLTPMLGAWVKAKEGAYYFLDKQRELGIIGINTAWLCEGDRDEKKLSPGKPLVENALNEIKECAIKVVLGHHPLEWLALEHRRPIEALFGKYNVIYLHGHLHESWASPQSGSGQPFLAVQSGAAFQAREHSIYKNGLLWANVNINEGVIQLQPRSWNVNNQDWSLSEAFPDINRKGEFWEFALPGKKKIEAKHLSSEVPGGWSVKDSASLLKHQKHLETALAVKYFDGAIPNWQVAASTSIPKRKIVSRLSTYFTQHHEGNASIVVALVGAGCEGKSTAILQAAFNIATNDDKWRVLRRGVETNELLPEQIIPVLDPNYDWLILIDDAENVIDGISRLVRRLPIGNKGRVHFLLASRDSDWQYKHNLILTEAGCLFYKERLSGLIREDAQDIVNCWSRYGDEGLGELKLILPEEQTAELLAASRRDVDYQGSAFFGALLRVRYGHDLNLHAAKMLERLSKRIIPTGGTLRDALSYIAAMDAVGLGVLSRPVLAFTLNCPESLLRKYVLQPLGEEAAATSTSDYVFTRHPLIAKTVMAVLEEEIGEDTDVIYVDLVNAALELYKKDYVLDLASWRYKIVDAFIELGRKNLAIKLIHVVRASEPNNGKILTKLAHSYRRASLPEKASELYEKYISDITVEMDRRVYDDWAIVERLTGNYANAGAIGLLAFADQLPYPHRLDVLNDKFQAIGYAFKSLYSLTRLKTFKDVASLLCIIGIKFSKDEEQKEEFQKNLLEMDVSEDEYNTSVESLTEYMFKASILAYDYITSEFIIDYVRAYGELTFNKLKRSLELVINSPVSSYSLR